MTIFAPMRLHPGRAREIIEVLERVFFLGPLVNEFTSGYAT